MPRIRTQLSTGLPGLDRVLRGLMAGDNIVWQVDSVDVYLSFVKPYAEYARLNRQRLIYFRFADHPPLLGPEDGAEVQQLHPEEGFEPFLNRIHETISGADRGSLYLFDCLSELAPDWCSDRMLGNFFMLTCPYLYDHAAIAYFTILRNRHSFHAMRPIANTTQVLIDAYRQRGRLYIHPIKVQHRHSVTMYMLHMYENEEFVPVTQSCAITEVLANAPWSRLESASYMLGYWSKTFAEAEAIQEDLDRGVDRQEEADAYFHTLIRMIISHDDRVQQLAETYMTLRDLLEIRRRMIGTGRIGGKAVGMLLAKAILRKDNPRWESVLEAHDSFYVGTDVFYTYLVQNGCWWMVQERKRAFSPENHTDTARRRLLAGDFPEYIQRQFADMLDYFGQSPVIVRSSSVLEDNFGNAFAGKYESVFCANQGGPHKRLEDFLCAVRTVYASMMDDEALVYREQRGLLQQDEQMALLIQRVSGATYNNLFFPQAAGVGYSFNSYVWHESIDPEAGMLRLVFGVGTRAVDRSDDDYTRIVALNAPTRRPESNFDEVREYAQQRVDVLDLEANHLTSYRFEDIEPEAAATMPIDLFASYDRKGQREQARQGRRALAAPGVLTFDKLLTQTDFVADMQGMMSALERAYQYPVDIEFTLNFFEPEAYKINIVQCRPLCVKGTDQRADPPEGISEPDIVLRSRGAVIGNSLVTPLDWIIYVVPEIYANLHDRDRHGVARLIDELTHHNRIAAGNVMLVGPGRWGTTTPALGVPVTFMDINRVTVLCEIVQMHAKLVPDVSLGTHFFNDLVENDMLYLALFPGKEGHLLNREFFDNPALDRFEDLLRRKEPADEALRALDLSALPGGARLMIHANTLKHEVVCYIKHIQPEAQSCGV